MWPQYAAVLNGGTMSESDYRKYVALAKQYGAAGAPLPPPPSSREKNSSYNNNNRAPHNR